MANGPDRADWWRRMLVERGGYPAPDRLRANLAGAELSEFCACGCNSFAVRASSDAPPLVEPGPGYGAVREVEFELPDDRTIEVILFVGDRGTLEYVEVDCCGNAYPVPDDVALTAPSRSRAYTPLLGVPERVQ